MVEQYANDAHSTLNGAINNSVTSLVVTSASGFPSVGQFRIILENEIMIVTAVSGTTFTVTRGAEGTSAASHVDTTPVNHIMTSASMLKLLSDGILADTYANLPAAGRAGRLFHCLDNPFTYLDNGSNWVPYWPGYGAPTPAIADFTTWVNQDGYTYDNSKGYARIYKAGGAPNAENIHARVRSASSSFTFQLGFVASGPPGSVWNAGIYLRESSSGKIMGLDIASNGNLNCWEWQDATNFHASVFNDAAWGSGLFGRTPCFLQLRSDGTNWYFEYSYDNGFNYVEHYRKTISGSYLAGFNQVGWGINGLSQNNANQVFAIDAFHASYF